VLDKVSLWIELVSTLFCTILSDWHSGKNQRLTYLLLISYSISISVQAACSYLNETHGKLIGHFFVRRFNSPDRIGTTGSICSHKAETNSIQKVQVV
jgi:hypothetical protein